MAPLGEWEYEKCVNHWGTKWDVSDEGLELSEDGTEIAGWFESAWAPPTTAMATFLEANTDCEVFLAYHEPGMDFAGIFTGSNGVCEDEELSNLYDEYKSETQSDLYQRIDEEFDITGWYESMEEDEDEEV